MPRCPGQDQRFWKPDDIFEINCPNCHTPTEFWKDEPQVKCPNCHTQITNPKLDLGCAKWCKYAKQCLGTLGSQDSSILCAALIEEMETIFADDKKQIDRSLEILKYAEQIQVDEGGEPLVVKAAAILHAIDTTEKSKQTTPITIVKEILVKHQIKTEMTEHICQIIGIHHSTDNIDTIESRIISDALRLASFSQQFPDAAGDKAKNLINSIFKTTKGRQIATERFVGPQD